MPLLDWSISAVAMMTTSLHPRRVYQDRGTARRGWSNESRRLFQAA